MYGPDQFITNLLQNRPVPKAWFGSNFQYTATSYGGSAAALNLIATSAGYTCVYLLHDMIFVRNDLLAAIGCKKPPPFGAIANGKIPRHVGFQPCQEQHLNNLLEVHSILAYPHLEVRSICPRTDLHACNSWRPHALVAHSCMILSLLCLLSL